jgi:hypothetical protein
MKLITMNYYNVKREFQHAWLDAVTYICLLLEKLKVHEQEWVLPAKYRRLEKPKISSYLLFCAFLDEGSLNTSGRLD